MLKTIIALVFFLNLLVFPQNNISGSLQGYIDSILTVMPSGEFSNEYQEPGTGQLTTWGNIIQYILNGNYTTADSLAGTLSYKLSAFTDTTEIPQKLYYLLAKTTAGTNHWGSFIFNQSPLRQKVVIQSPHPLFDTHTGKQGIAIFKMLGARVFCISGAHRCNSSDSSACAGTTSVCTGLTNVRFRKSDPPHNVNATFQRTTEILNSSISGLLVVQNHGFDKGTGEPDLIMSNGVAKQPETDYLATVKSSLLSIDSTLTFKILHVDTTWNTLTGTTNVQGRLINGSNNPCSKSASVNTGRFLHIEQAYSKLRNTEANRARLGTALASAFPQDPLPVELVSFQASVKNCSVLLSWQTATEFNNAGFSVQRKHITEPEKRGDWVTVGFVPGSGNSNSPKHYYFQDELPASGYYSYRLMQLDNDGSRSFSPERNIAFSDNAPMRYEMAMYPNPCNAATKIALYIPQAGRLVLSLYDVTGRKIQTIKDDIFEVGRSEIYCNAEHLSSGVYFLQLLGTQGSIMKKLVIMK